MVFSGLMSAASNNTAASPFTLTQPAPSPNITTPSPVLGFGTLGRGRRSVWVPGGYFLGRPRLWSVPCWWERRWRYRWPRLANGHPHRLHKKGFSPAANN
jgi:hypothetical protein